MAVRFVRVLFQAPIKDGPSISNLLYFSDNNSIAGGRTLSAGAGENLLQNPGFEDGTSGWSTYGGALSIVGSQVHSGGSAAAFESNSATTKWIYQVVPVSGGESYTFSGYAIKNDPNIETIFLRISWYQSQDGFGTEIAHHDSLSSLTDDQSQYRFLTTGEITAPADAHSARVKAILEPVSDGEAIAFFDDFKFEGPPPATPTPTPTPTPKSRYSFLS